MNIIDLHCDTVWRLMEEGEHHSLYRNPFCVDIEKLKASQTQAQFFALFANKAKTDDLLTRVLAMADRFFHELEAHHEQIALARNYEELRQNCAGNKISAFLTVEDGGALQGDVANLERFYRLGVRLITLTWNYPNELGYPNCRPEYRGLGLTPAGRQMVSEMNRLGVLVDVSHLSDQGFYDVAALSTKPFTASHSNARAVTAHFRNVTDEMIKLMAEKGGVIGLNFENTFLGISPISQVADMVLHLNHIRKVGGIEVVAIGSDFDGTESELEIAHAGQMNKLVQALESSGWGQDEIEKLCWGNAARLIKDTLV